MNTFSTTQFAYDKTSRSFYTDASDVAETYVHGLDIRLVSHATGRGRVFVYTGPLKDCEGDVVGWLYSSACGLSVTIGND